MFSQNSCNLSQLFEAPVENVSMSFFQVPPYQRKYDCESEKQVSKLIDDIFENIGRPYFLGSIIICYPPVTSDAEVKKGKVPNFAELIDGQQRLATLAIFIRAMIDYIQQRKNEGSFPARLIEEMNKLQYKLVPKLQKGELIQNESVIHLAKKIDKFFVEEIIMNK